NPPKHLVANPLTAAIGHCFVVGYTEQPSFAGCRLRLVPPLNQLGEGRLEHIGRELGVPKDAEQEPPQLLPVLDIQFRDDGWVERAVCWGWHASSSCLAAKRSLTEQDALWRGIIGGGMPNRLNRVIATI